MKQMLGGDFSEIKEKLMNIANYFRKYDRYSEIIERFNTILQKVYYAEQLILNYYILAEDMDTSDNNMLFKFVTVDFNKLKPFQKIMLKLFDILEKYQYMKKNDMLYEEIKIPYKTHAWKPVSTIAEFIHKHCSMSYDYENWLLMTSAKDMDRQLETYFIKSVDTRLPTLQHNRNMFSFKNGIYFTLRDEFVTYDTQEHQAILANEVSSKYFDIPFRYVEETNPSNIHTPFLDSIYLYQQLPQEVIEINKMFLGRMLYNVGDLDQWQVIPFLLGSGGTGKSTIHNIIRSFYEHEDVGVIGNNYQKTFGLADIYDKTVFVAPEIKKDWGIDQAEFQEIVSGGRVNINRKNKASLTVQWTTPGMLAGNENPGFVDNASSIQRRIVLTRFDHKVLNNDPELGTKLDLEMDAIIKQCNLYYIAYAKQYKNNDIWTWLPQYYIDTQNMMAKACNALNAFIGSDQVKLSTYEFIPMDEFFKQFNYFCRNNNFRRPNITVDMYKAPFAKSHITVEERVTKTYNGRIYTNTSFLVGVDMFKD